MAAHVFVLLQLNYSAILPILLIVLANVSLFCSLMVSLFFIRHVTFYPASL
jgi:hypothetical protein